MECEKKTFNIHKEAKDKLFVIQILKSECKQIVINEDQNVRKAHG